MATVQMVEYGTAAPEVRAIYDEIMAVKGIDFVPNFWKTLASHPPLLAEVWRFQRDTAAFGAPYVVPGEQFPGTGRAATAPEMEHALAASKRYADM